MPYWGQSVRSELPSERLCDRGGSVRRRPRRSSQPLEVDDDEEKTKEGMVTLMPEESAMGFYSPEFYPVILVKEKLPGKFSIVFYQNTLFSPSREYMTRFSTFYSI